MNAQVGALSDPGSDPVKEADANDEVIAITAETLRKMRAVPEPAGASAALAAIFAKVDTVLADAKALSTALRARDQTAATAAATKVSASSDAANTASNDYGLTVCGS